jgi:hypothetical protein
MTVSIFELQPKHYKRQAAAVFKQQTTYNTRQTR